MREEHGGDVDFSTLHRIIDYHNKRKSNRANQLFRQSKGDSKIEDLDTEGGEEEIGGDGDGGKGEGGGDHLTDSNNLDPKKPHGGSEANGRLSDTRWLAHEALDPVVSVVVCVCV